MPGTHRESCWTADLTPEAQARDSQLQSLESFLVRWLQRLAAHAEALLALRDEGGRGEFFVGLFCNANCGLALTPGLMAEAARLGIELSLDLYPPERRADPT